MPKRSLNRRSVIVLLIGGMISQAIYGGLRALTLAHDRLFAIAAYGSDPSPDIWINSAVLVAAIVGALALLSGRRWAWWLCIAVLGIGAADALRLVEAPYGGAGYVGLLVLRAATIYLFVTPLARAVCGFGSTDI